MSKIQAKKIISKKTNPRKSNPNIVLDGDRRQSGNSKKIFHNSVNKKQITSNKIKRIKSNKISNNKRTKPVPNANKLLTIKILQNQYIPWHFGAKFQKFFSKRVRSLVGGDENVPKSTKRKFSPSTFDSESTFEEGFTKDDEMTSISHCSSTLASSTSDSLSLNQNKKSKHSARSLPNGRVEFTNRKFEQSSICSNRIQTNSRNKIDSLLLIRKKLSKRILNDCNLYNGQNAADVTTIQHQQHKDQNGSEQNDLPLINMELAPEIIEQLQKKEREILVNMEDNLDKADSISIKNFDMSNLSLSLTMDSEEQEAQLKSVLEIMKKLHSKLSIT